MSPYYIMPGSDVTPDDSKNLLPLDYILLDMDVLNVIKLLYNDVDNTFAAKYPELTVTFFSNHNNIAKMNIGMSKWLYCLRKIINYEYIILKRREYNKGLLTKAKKNRSVCHKWYQKKKRTMLLKLVGNIWRRKVEVKVWFILKC